MNFIRDKKIIVAIDYDDTIAKNNKITKLGLKMLNKIRKMPVTMVLWTCRKDELLQEALLELEKYNFKFDYINDTDGIRNEGRKISADIYIDNKNPGGV